MKITSDNNQIPPITERQEYILDLIVREHIRTGEPVGSKTLVERFDLGFSSATVRNEMVALEQHGLIYAPHTSAGRVPTQKGFRYFARHLLRESGLSVSERNRIAQEFQQVAQNVDEWPRLAAVVLARTAQSAALVTPPRARETHFKHLELISTQGRMVLMVLVLHGGAVHQEILTLAEPVEQEQLSHTANNITAVCAGLTADGVRAQTRTIGEVLAGEVGELVAEAMQHANQQTSRDVYGYGLSDSLPSFGEDAAQQALRVMEQQTSLDDVLDEVFAADESDVRVVVAGEGRWESLSHLSVVLGRYGTPNTIGALGVLGPTRMRYGRAISAVRYVAHLMSGMLDTVYGSSSNE